MMTLTTLVLNNSSKDNLQNWEKYEKSRDALTEKLNEADKEFKNTKKVFDLNENVKDHATRTRTAADMRKDIEETCKNMTDAFEVLSKLAQANKKSELEKTVSKCMCRQQLDQDLSSQQNLAPSQPMIWACAWVRSLFLTFSRVALKALNFSSSRSKSKTRYTNYVSALKFSSH